MLAISSPLLRHRKCDTVIVIRLVTDVCLTNIAVQTEGMISGAARILFFSGSKYMNNSRELFKDKRGCFALDVRVTEGGLRLYMSVTFAVMELRTDQLSCERGLMECLGKFHTCRVN